MRNVRNDKNIVAMTSSVLIVGASSGIGLALTHLYASRGNRVFATCRKLNADMLIDNVTVREGVDVTDESTFGVMGGREYGLVIVVAGVASVDALTDKFLVPTMQQVFDVNTLGPVRVLQFLLTNKYLRSGSKFVVISSGLGSLSLAAKNGNCHLAYGTSKAALNFAMVAAGAELRAQGIALGIFAPGVVSTRMNNFTEQGISPEDSAEGLLRLVEELDLHNSMRFLKIDGEELPW